MSWSSSSWVKPSFGPPLFCSLKTTDLRTFQELVPKMQTALRLPVRKTAVLTNIAFSHRLLYQILSGCATNRAVHDCVLFGCTLLFGHQNRKSIEMTHASSRGGGSPLFPVTVKRSPLWIWSGVTVLHQTRCQLFVYSFNPQSPNAPQIHSHKHISDDNYDVQISGTTQEDKVWRLKAWPCFVSLRWLLNKVFFSFSIAMADDWYQK